MIANASPPPRRWADATREVAPLLTDRTCVVIVGERADDAARLTIELATAQARTRRVAIVDAVGDLERLQKLLPPDAGPHGIIDHFLHGVSLRKVAHPVNREKSLFVVPSGAGPFEYETLLRRERWRRLTMAFRNERALLCVVLPRDAEGLAGFVEDTDGIVLVGDVPYAESRHVLATVGSAAPVSGDAGTVTRAPTSRMAGLRHATRKVLSRPAARLAAVAAALVAVAALFGLNRADDRDDARTAASQAIGLAQRPGIIDASAEDSATAATYSIEVVMLNNLDDASSHLRDRLASIPTSTFSPLLLGTDSARWYRVLVGAWRDRQQADSALIALREAQVLEPGLGSVRATPYAIRIAHNAPPTTAVARMTELRAQGFPAYVLQRDEGHAGVFAGAFETPSQAMALLDMFKRAGIDATIAYRIGRGI